MRLVPYRQQLDTVLATIANYIAFTVFGRNTDIDIAAGEDVWRTGGTFVAPTAARVHAVVSSSANDASAGTGARTVRVSGLNASYVLTSETVTLNGTTPVNTSNSYIHIHRIEALTFGSGGVSAGVITATAATDLTVTATLPAGVNETATGVYVVPAGYTAHVLSWGGIMQSSTAGAEAVLQLRSRAFGEAGFVVEDQVTLNRADRRIFNREFNPARTFPEKTTIKLTVPEVSRDNTDISGYFDIVLVAD